MKLSEMRRWLEERDIRLTKSLGQNFLHDGNQIRRIVDLAGVGPTDRVLEIGPGLGPLTDVLLERGCEVIAIEHDARLVSVLKQRHPNHPHLTVVEADAVVFLRQTSRNWSDWKVVSNLPYSVASVLLAEFSAMEAGPVNVTITLQSEVAGRLLAAAGTSDYGILTLLVLSSYAPVGSFKIPATSFFPEPSVESACLGLQRRIPPLILQSQRTTFTRIVKRAFSQRRKMMFKLLRADWPEDALRAAFEALGIHSQIRAEKVSLADFARLTTHLHSYAGHLLEDSLRNLDFPFHGSAKTR